MPVTIRSADHGAEALQFRRWRESEASSVEKLVLCTNTDDLGESKQQIRGLVAASFPRTPKDFESNGRILSSKNGFVNACIDAYNDHHNLVIRPEDVWFAILSQLSIYVNHNAEALRNQFVNHEGRDDLFIEVDDMEKVDNGEMAVMMTKLMNDKIKNPDTRNWIMPTFTTTEKTDQTVAAVMFMGTMQKYFTYSWGTRCGIPSVTLEGEIRDWADMHDRIRKMTDIFGAGVAGFRNTVLPAVEGMAKSFLDAEGQGKRFWQGVCVQNMPNGSGSPTYTGWITAFTYWAEDGRCLHSPGTGNASRGGSPGGKSVMHLRRGDVPCGFVRVPVVLKYWDHIVNSDMTAGSVAIRATDAAGRKSSKADTLRPQSGWFLYKT
ncbi:hypothetical protein MKZ38_008456 [Zalerion maritima]|uniref:Uncharacterized protein n=1 Tax=Zalerion maritima TaxID=339359 RepID=A0AAD5WW42_9PEZI|nr:hypothetical protein MKZ38_008456 [Zalerion maritima]